VYLIELTHKFQNCVEKYATKLYIDDKSLCENLYEKNKNNKFAIINNFIPTKKCDEILSEGINYAHKNKWTTERHDNYPTTDNEVTQKWKCYDYLEKKVHGDVFNKISQLYNIDKNNLHIKELFIIKYEDTKQNKLITHTDGNEFSFVMALNNISEYNGGGTYFVNQQKTIKLRKGNCLVFSGQNKHKGVAITKGKRFILTGFINFKSNEFCDDILSENIEK